MDTPRRRFFPTLVRYIRENFRSTSEIYGYTFQVRRD